MSEGVLPDVASAAPSQASALGRTSVGSRTLRLDDVRVVAELGRVALVWSALFVMYGDSHQISSSALVAIAVAALVWLVALRAAAASAHFVLGRPLAAEVGTVMGLAVVAALNSSVVGLHVSVTSLAIFALGILCSMIVWDWFVEYTIAGKRRVLLVGTEGLDVVTEELSTCRRPRFELVGAVSGSLELAHVVAAQRPDIVVLADDAAYDAALDSILDAGAKVRVATIAGFFEYAFGRIPIEEVSPAWFMCLLHPRQHTYSRLTKRVFDIAVASLGLLLAAPILTVLAVLTKVNGNSVLYRQTRVGEGGRRFTIYKLRTMNDDAESNGARFSSNEDSRVTTLGAGIRRMHLDELPQLWNVLRGEMSIVGPRPERPEFIEVLEAAVPFWNRRLLVKPGITGWAQVRCGYAGDCDGMRRKLSYDLWYLRHRSLFVDIAVCVTTCFAIAGRALKS